MLNLSPPSVIKEHFKYKECPNTFKEIDLIIRGQWTGDLKTRLYCIRATISENMFLPKYCTSKIGWKLL